MAKEKSKNIYEVAYYNGEKVIVVPVCAERVQFLEGAACFFNGETTGGPIEAIDWGELTCVFHGFIYVKKLADDRPQPMMAPPSGFTEEQIRLISGKIVRIPSDKKD